MQIALDVGVPDFDLECAKTLLGGVAEQFLKVMIGEVEIEAARINGHALAFGSKHSPKRQV